MSQRKIVARGSIRVDARKAQAKLREHLLVDLHAYTLEVARAAIALGATRLDVHWDADDVELAFDGEPIGPDRLSRLLDFALSSAEDEHSAALRTLALGVNAAIGLEGAYVEVVSSAGQEAWRVRWTPEHRSDSDSAPAPQPVAERVARPERGFVRGTLVHFRRRLGLEVLTRWLGGSVPREVALLAQNTHEAKLQIRENGRPMRRSALPPALLRVPVTLPGTERAFVEILPAGSSAETLLLERGVRLLGSTWVPLPGLEPVGDRVLPARLVVDADELPTNASRSALQEDSPLGVELAHAGSDGFRRALSALVARVCGKGEAPADALVLADDPVALEDALGAIVNQVAGAVRGGRSVAPELSALLSLPLLHGAGGNRLSVASMLERSTIAVWTGPVPPPVELAPWFGQVVWLRKRAVEGAIAHIRQRDAAALIERARRGAARRNKLLQHPASEPAVPKSVKSVARRRFRYVEGSYGGLSGEVALLSHEGERTPPSLLRMFVEGRMIEALPLAPSVWPLGMDAAVTWTEGLQPRFDYDGIERNEGLNRALLGVLHIALGLANRVAIDLARVSPAQRAGVEAMLRGAVSAWTVVPAALGYAERAEASLGTEHEALYSAPIFPTIEPERRTSLRELAAYAARTRIVCVVPSWRARSASPAPDGRPVLVASAEEQARIVQALGGSLTLARYEAPEHSVDDAPSRRAALARALGEVARGGPVLWYERQGLIAAAMPAPTAITLEAHRGVVLARTERKKAQAPVMFAFDDPRTIPCSDWNGVAWAPPRRFAAYGQTLCKKLLAALCGDTAAQQQLGGRVDPDAPGVAALMIEWALALRRRRKRAAANAAMLKSLEQLPLLIWLDENGAPARVSLAEVEQRHGDAPPLLAAGVGFETLDWAPLVARSAREKSALARRFPRAFPAEHEIEERRSMAMRRAKKRVLMLQPAIALDDLSGYALAGEPSVRLPAEEDAKDGWNMDVIVALPTPGRPADAPWFSVCFEQRPVCTLSGRELGIPVVGRASSRDETDFEDLTGLTRSGRERVLARAGAAAERLALDKLGAAVRTRRAATVLSDPRALVLLTWLLEHRDAALLAARLMSDDFPWPTVQGEEAPWSSLARRDGELWFGRELFPKWRARAGLVTDLDRPVLAIPPGPAEGALVALLQRMGARLRDMSAPLAKLQAQRGASATSPRLIGAPAHPSMRASLGELGCTIGDGEAELVEGPESDVTVLLLGGAQARSALKLVVPLRAVLRVDATDEASLRAPLTAALGAAGRALVLRALAAFADPPRRVRQAARRLIREALSAHETCAPELAGVACYEDTAGHPLRLSDLVLKKRWSFTTREPPYPPGLTPLLCLSSDEVPALRTVVELVAADHQVDRASAAEKRRTARPLAEIALSDADRAHCLVTAPLVGENVRGEVGVLRPSFAGDRGCSLYVAGRPLSKFSDEPGFPVLASIDDASVEPDRWFEGPKHPSVVDGLRKRVRDGARVALQRVFAAPPSALAKRWLESEPCEMLEVTGQLWVSGESCAPAVRVHCAGQIAPVVRALKLEGASAALDPTLPLEGNLLVFGCADPERIFAALGRLGQRLVREMVAEACARGARSPALEELCASLALLGLDPSPPLVRACDGRAISYAELLAELENTGVLWLGDGRGSVEGAFPNALPPFVLPDDGSALLRVLARRAKPGSLRRVGEVAAAPVPPRPVSLSVPPVRAEPVVEEPAGNLWDRVRAAVAGDPTPDDPMPVAPELAPLARLLSSLALSGEPIARVLGGQGGRPTRYEAATKTLWVSTSHPVVAALLARPGDPEGLHALTAHALTEINRALVEVTDGEELRALLALLRET